MPLTSRLHDLLAERFTALDLRQLVMFDERLATARLGAVVNFDRAVRQVAFDLVEAATQRNLLPALAAAASRARPQVPEAVDLARLFGSARYGAERDTPGARDQNQLASGPGLGAPLPRSPRLSGNARLELQDGLVSRWERLAVYFEASTADRSTFERATSPPGKLLDWLEERMRLHELRGAFGALGWGDLVEVLDRHPQ